MVLSRSNSVHFSELALLFLETQRQNGTRTSGHPSFKVAAASGEGTHSRILPLLFVVHFFLGSFLATVVGNLRPMFMFWESGSNCVAAKSGLVHGWRDSHVMFYVDSHLFSQHCFDQLHWGRISWWDLRTYRGEGLGYCYIFNLPRLQTRSLSSTSTVQCTTQSPSIRLST